MLRKNPLVSGETYHIYNRGAHKLQVFDDPEDYDRFLLLLFLANNTKQIQVRNVLSFYQGPSLVEVFEKEKPDKKLVDVLAYCLMPNHFHLLLKQKAENGISTFMRKVVTGYAMYRNIKHEHSGVVFQGRFKSVLVDDEAYFRYIFSYIHLNPISLVEHEWKELGIVDEKRVHDFVRSYEHSSYIDYSVVERSKGNILTLSEVPSFIKNADDLKEMLRYSRSYQGPSLVSTTKDGPW